MNVYTVQLMAKISETVHADSYTVEDRVIIFKSGETVKAIVPLYNVSFIDVKPYEQPLSLKLAWERLKNESKD